MRFLLFGLALAAASAADYELIIRNARVLDGTGNPWYVADVGIHAGKIDAIGRLNNRTADRTIDAAQRILSPGFIDVHTHIESGIEKVPRGDNYLLDGVTTLVTGNCGSSILDLGGWFRKLETLRIGLNIASLIGHNTVRAEVIGTSFQKASDPEIEQMQRLVDRGMADGAVGFSTGLIYIPGTYSDTREVVALAASAVNGCDYCLAAHEFFGGKTGLTAAELAAARAGTLSAVARLAREVTEQRGQLHDEQLQAARAAGLDDARIVEVVAQVSLLTLTNYLNNLAATEVDFPPAA